MRGSKKMSARAPSITDEQHKLRIKNCKPLNQTELGEMSPDAKMHLGACSRRRVDKLKAEGHCCIVPAGESPFQFHWCEKVICAAMETNKRRTEIKRLGHEACLVAELSHPVYYTYCEKTPCTLQDSIRFLDM